jgi:acyl-coenzyme A thioesterase PaaI-like protein
MGRPTKGSTNIFIYITKHIFLALTLSILYIMPTETISDFSPPWAQALINDHAWELVPTNGREEMPPPSTENALMALALDRPDGVRAVLSFNRYPSPPSSSSPSSSSPTSFKGFETRMLFSLGTGVNGHSGFCHGGFIGTLIDEACGQCAFPIFGSAVVTAEMTVQYKKMLPTPSIVLCRAWIEEEPEGRKVWVKASVEDGQGGVYATGKTLFIKTKAKI